MEILSTIKTQIKNHQLKMSELNNQRGERLAKISIAYAGGYDSEIKSNDGQLSLPGKLFLYEKYANYVKSNNNFMICGERIKGIQVEGREEVYRRVTATRLLALGIFAFAFKKRKETKEAFVTFLLNDGRQVVFHTRVNTPTELKRTLFNAISYYSKQSQKLINEQPKSTDPAKEITKYAVLRKQGIITNQEFQTKKKQLLDL